MKFSLFTTLAATAALSGLGLAALTQEQAVEIWGEGNCYCTPQCNNGIAKAPGCGDEMLCCDNCSESSAAPLAGCPH